MSNETDHDTSAPRPEGSSRRTLARLKGMLGRLLGRGLAASGNAVDRAIRWVEEWLVGGKKARYGLAVTRVLLGFTGLGLLLTNFRTRLYTFGSGSAWNGEAAEPLSSFPKIWIFSLFHKLALHDTWFTIATVVLGVLAILVTLGWRTKVILPIFFVMWVSFIEMTDPHGDQWDNMYRITLLTLLFADTASVWSLDAKRRRAAAGYHGPWWRRAVRGAPFVPSWISNAAHNLALVVVATHVSMVYAAGALYKAGGAPWQHGYAIYNPLHTPRYDTWPERNELFTTWALMVVAISWASIILQMFFPMMLFSRPTRIIALLGIGGFHMGIGVLMGLPWFSLAMIAIDAIFVRDRTWKGMSRSISEAWRSTDSPAPPVAGAEAEPEAAPVRV